MEPRVVVGTLIAARCSLAGRLAAAGQLQAPGQRGQSPGPRPVRPRGRRGYRRVTTVGGAISSLSVGRASRPFTIPAVTRNEIFPAARSSLLNV